MIDTLNQNIQNLSQSEQEQLFKLLSENVEILIKLIPDAPLLKYIKSGYTTNDDPVIQAYSAWKNKN
jgi:hypothetical protein